MRSFIEWLEANNANQTTVGLRNVADTPYDSGSQASFHYDPRYPVRNPNDHWAFKMFKDFYANSWGRWDEVEAAAHRNPQVAALMKQIQQTLETQGLGQGIQPQIGIDGEPEYDIDKPTLMQQLATKLQRSIRGMLPNHGYGQGGSSTRPGSPLTTSRATGAAPQQGGMPSTQAMNPQTRTVGPARASQSQSPYLQKTEVLPLLQQLLQRIERIENHITRGGTPPSA